MLWSLIALRCADCDEELTRVRATEPHFSAMRKTLVMMATQHRERQGDDHRIIWHLLDEGET